MGVINMHILQVSRCELSVTMITTAILQRLYVTNKSAAASIHSTSICLTSWGNFSKYIQQFSSSCYLYTVSHLTKLYIKVLCQLSCHKTKILHL